MKILAPRDIQPAFPDKVPGFSDAEVIIGVGLHNQAASIRRCFDSIFAQNLHGRKFAVVLLDDQSSDDWQGQITDYLNLPEVIALQGHCGSPARARNAILDYADENFPEAKWIARLDADDRFSCPDSLFAAVNTGENTNAGYVLGGNRLVKNGRILDRENPATQNLLEFRTVLAILEEMAADTATNELPSCNLLLSAHSPWRYPDVKSAEDHWLVAGLLMIHGGDGAILESPYYCDYTLEGAETTRNAAMSHRYLARRQLYNAATTWGSVKSLRCEIIGHGQEGMVLHVDGYIEKHFYPEVLSDIDVTSLKGILAGAVPFLPAPEWYYTEGRWVARYPYVLTDPAEVISIDQAREFLTFCLAKGFVCKNIKRQNFRVTPDGRLLMTDVGKDVVPMNIHLFRDSAARLYAIAALGHPDGEYLRRNDTRREEDVLHGIPGFEKFYHELIMGYAYAQWQETPCLAPVELPKADDISLLIKCCPMDAGFLEHQVRYMVSLLSKPRSFHEILLIVDSYSGPYLRQYCPGNYKLLLKKAQELQRNGTIDRFLVAPTDEKAIREINSRWFNLDFSAPRTTQTVPVASQLWGFGQVETRYVLQCDVDVLIGRRDLEHDYLSEMREACAGHEDVLGVAFNIPHPDGNTKPYDAPLGEYVPEVRCGLLDLERIQACCPLPNSISDGGLLLTWHRSLQQRQKEKGLRTLRGGDAQTFYIHPPNDWKHDPGKLAVIRDLISQGVVPDSQMNEWDLKDGKWYYSCRGEDIVFLLKGRNTPADQLKRCFSSLKMQLDQDFGLVVIDDASDTTDIALLQHYLKPFRERATLIRRPQQTGRIPNFITGIKKICTNPDTLIVILDLDDALISPNTVLKLRDMWNSGHDVILGGMFRTDKPFKLYAPDFHDIRRKWGGNVWAHLRSFRKRLFDALPADALKIAGNWITECTDYATMIPIVEASSSPVFIPEYLYCHEPTTVRTPEVRVRKENLIRLILAKQPQLKQTKKT